MRYFNSSEPNIIEQHYTLMRSDLVAKGLDMVKRDRYFTIWAPPKSGKSTYFKLLANSLETQGYKVAYLNCKHFKEVSMKTFLAEFHLTVQKSWDLTINSDTIVTTFSRIEQTKNAQFVLIVDDIDYINPDFLGVFLISIRVAFHSRSEHALKSVILSGVTNILDIVYSMNSSFNIADDFYLPYFKNEETFDLLGQHEKETGQLFESSVKKQISEITANQPSLVNGLAALLVQQNPHKSVITHYHYLAIEHLYVTKALDKNVLNRISQSTKCRVLIGRLLLTKAKIKFQIYREDIRELYFNGIVSRDENGYVMLRVPLYQQCLHQAFPNLGTDFSTD